MRTWNLLCLTIFYHQLVIFAALLALAAAAPRPQSQGEINPEDIQKLLTIQPDELQEPLAIGDVMRGSYAYVEDGVVHTVNWVADENGNQPEDARHFAGLVV